MGALGADRHDVRQTQRCGGEQDVGDGHEPDGDIRLAVAKNAAQGGESPDVAPHGVNGIGAVVRQVEAETLDRWMEAIEVGIARGDGDVGPTQFAHPSASSTPAANDLGFIT